MLSWLQYPSPVAAAERILLLMLPAAGCRAEEFEAEGMVAEAQASGLPIGIIAVQPELELYLDGGIATALHGQIVEPAMQQGYRRVWMLGISLGGMGALLYAASHAAMLEGVILLAPFLGTKGTIASLARSGGILRGTEPGITTATERSLLTWLREFGASGCNKPVLYLGYGEADRFSSGHLLLAEILPPAHVAILPGGHDWPCWRACWRQLLACIPFGHDGIEDA
jgi:hypothetical protein